MLHVTRCIGILFALGGCIDTRLLRADNLNVRLPAPQPAGWRADIAALLQRYEQAPVVKPEDTRLEPLIGGLTTLSFFGADAQARLQDQVITQPAARGGNLTDACAAPFDRAADTFFATTGRPAFTPVWLPLAQAGGVAPPSVLCDEHGRPHGEGKELSFCAFGRLALQAEARPLIQVVHGLFDSGAQDYVQHSAAALYRAGYAVLLPDMRDHGDTLRADPNIATTLGTLEGTDLLAIAQATRTHCAARIAGIGIAGTSGGALAAIRALTQDRTGLLDKGVLALSPLLDVPGALRDLADGTPCAATRSIELTWLDDALIAAAAAAVSFGGAALVQGLTGQPLSGHTAAVGGIGAGAGLLGALSVDAFFDGGAMPCVSEHAIAQIVQDVLKVRWATLQRFETALSPLGQRSDPRAATLAGYLRERVDYRAQRLGTRIRQLDPRALAQELRTALSTRPDARLLVLGAEDDPMTRSPALHDFERRTRGLPQVYVAAVAHGGHGGMWIVQPPVTQRIFERFFGASSQ